MALVHFLGLRTYTVELRRDLEQLEKQFNDLVNRVAPLFANEPSSSFTSTTINQIGLPATGFADPVNPVILEHTPGVLKKAMRADGAPKLSQAIAPTWTAQHTWSPSTDVVPVTIQKTSALETDDLLKIMDTDSSELVIVDNLGLVGVNCRPDSDSIVTIQGAADALPIPVGPLAWYKADAITGVADGANISSWLDSSGNGHHLTATGKKNDGTASTTRPTWYAVGGVGTGIQNGVTIGALPAVSTGTTLGGVNNDVGFFTIDTGGFTLTVSTGWTIAIIARDFGVPPAQALSQTNYLLGVNNTDANSDFTARSGWDGTGTNHASWFSVTSTTNYTNYYSHTDGNDTEYIILRKTAGTASTGLMEGWVDGVLQPNAGTPNGGLTRGDMLVRNVFCQVTGGTYNGFHRVSFAEIIIWNRDLDADEIIALNDYLSDRIAGNPIVVPSDTDLTHWNDSGETTLSRVNASGYLGIGVEPNVPIDVVLDSQQLRIGPSDTEWTGFYYTGAAQINYTLPATSTTGILHNTSSVWSWSLVSLTGDVTGTLPVANGGTGATTLTGILQGNGTSAVTAITNSSTVGQILRVTGASTYAWGALDLADTDAITNDLPYANLTPSGAASKLLGRGSASGAGDWQEITLGTGLSMSGTTLNSSSSGVATDSIWDAKGDLAVGTGADTAVRLAVGTNDYVLTADSAQTTGVKWAAVPSSGGSGTPVVATTTDFELATVLLETLLTGTQANFTVSSISSAAYDYIEIELLARSSVSGVEDSLIMSFNSDTTDANYRRTYIGGSGGPGAVAGDADSRQIGVTSGDTSLTSSYAAIHITIPNPGSAKYKASFGSSAMRQSSAGVTYVMGHHFESTSAIDSIVLTLGTGPNFMAGSYCLIKGFKLQSVVTAVSGTVNSTDPLARHVLCGGI